MVIFSPGNLGQYNAANDTKIKISRRARKLKVSPFSCTLTAAWSLHFTLPLHSLYHQASKETTLHIRSMTLKGKHWEWICLCAPAPDTCPCSSQLKCLDPLLKYDVLGGWSPCLIQLCISGLGLSESALMNISTFKWISLCFSLLICFRSLVLTMFTLSSLKVSWGARYGDRGGQN